MDGFEGDVYPRKNTHGFSGNEKSTFHETKEVVSRLREPLKIKAVAITSTDPAKQGHMLEVTANTGWGGIDELEKDIRDLIKMWVRIIESPVSEGGLGSKYMGIRMAE
jgi:hypothetical protein